MKKLRRILNVNIIKQKPLITPQSMRLKVPLSQQAHDNVLTSRETLKRILDGLDPRRIIIAGPCSIHDPKAALEYAQRLTKLAERVRDIFFIVMRVYFEKPRTAMGWKGLINDPLLDDSFQIGLGLKLARQLLLQINEMELPAGTEALDPITPQYFAELITWSVIGARTIESQTHRELSSGLSMPVGFKNATNGSIEVALNAIKSASQPHHFLGINEKGAVSVFSTRANRYGHLVLRGGWTHPNYDEAHVKNCLRALKRRGLRERVIIDCSHSNSRCQHQNQPVVFNNCIQQMLTGNKNIAGLMLESNLNAGRQDVSPRNKKLRYGVSVTDACLDWNTTEKIICNASDLLRNSEKHS